MRWNCRWVWVWKWFGDIVGNGAEFGIRDGPGDREGGAVGLWERTGIRAGLVNCFSPALFSSFPHRPGLLSYLNYINFWSILAIQAIWT